MSSDSPHQSPPETVFAHYRVRADKEQEFLALLAKHYPALASVGLVTEKQPAIWRGHEHDGGLLYIEIFEWVSGEAAEIAHRTPEVMAIWEPMGACVEARDGRPQFEFPHLAPCDPSGAGA